MGALAMEEPNTPTTLSMNAPLAAESALPRPAASVLPAPTSAVLRRPMTDSAALEQPTPPIPPVPPAAVLPDTPIYPGNENSIVDEHSVGMPTTNFVDDYLDLLCVASYDGVSVAVDVVPVEPVVPAVQPTEQYEYACTTFPADTSGIIDDDLISALTYADDISTLSSHSTQYTLIQPTKDIRHN